MHDPRPESPPRQNPRPGWSLSRGEGFNSTRRITGKDSIQNLGMQLLNLCSPKSNGEKFRHLPGPNSCAKLEENEADVVCNDIWPLIDFKSFWILSKAAYFD